jgi:hypothetical protein
MVNESQVDKMAAAPEKSGSVGFAPHYEDLKLSDTMMPQWPHNMVFTQDRFAIAFGLEQRSAARHFIYGKLFSPLKTDHYSAVMSQVCNYLKKHRTAGRAIVRLCGLTQFSGRRVTRRSG